MNLRMEEKKILDQILGNGVYDPRIRPAGIYNSTGKVCIWYRTNKFGIIYFTSTKRKIYSRYFKLTCSTFFE